MRSLCIPLTPVVLSAIASGRRMICLGLIALVGVRGLSADQARDELLDAPFAALAQYDWGPSRDALQGIDVAIVLTHDKPEARRYLEDRLLSVLESDAPRGAKDYVCRKLCQIGTDRSVPSLALLLKDPALAHMARGVLEKIAGESVTQVLCEAVPQLQGDLKLGVIYTLGRRADPRSISALVPLLNDEDPSVVSAAITALGAIDAPESDQAVLALRQSAAVELEEAIVVACLKIAQRQLQKGESAAAADVYRSLETHDAQHIQCAVLRGLVQAVPGEACARLMHSLGCDNEQLRRFAAECVRELADQDLVEQLASDMAELPIAGQVCLLDALSQWDLPSVRSAALSSLRLDSTELQAAAARVLVRCGEPEDVELLAEFATRAQPEVREAAENTLEHLAGEAVDRAIVQRIEVAPSSEQVMLARAIATRQIDAVAPVLFKLVHSPDEQVRIAAFAALETVADLSLADELVKCLAATQPGKEREAAQRAVWKSCSPVDDETERVAPILRGLAEADSQQRAALLPALGLLGGATARQVVDAARNDSDELVRDAAIRAICNWPDTSVADELLEIARNGQQPSHRIWALRGFARVIGRQAKEKPQETLDGLREAMQLATRQEEKQLILSRLTAVRLPDSLTLSLSLLDDTDLRLDAIEAVASLAEGMKDTYPKESRAALEEVLKASQDPELQLYVQKLLWNMQLKGN